MQETKYTYCRVCEPNCGLVATLEDGKLVKVAGDKEHPFSRGYICERAKASVAINRDPDRIRYPMRRVDGKLARVSWDEALQDIGKRLAAIRKQYGPHSVAAYIGNPIAFDSSFTLFLQMGLLSLGTRNVYTAGSQDCNNKFVASERVLGSPLLHPLPDIDNIEFLIIIGGNPAVSKMSFNSISRVEERLKGIEKRGGRVVIIDPRRSETANLMGEHHFIRPDTDVFLLSAMLHVIIREGLFDSAHIQRHTEGFDDLKRFVASFPPERVADLTGIDAGTITKLAIDFAKAGKACVYSSVGLNMGTFGTLAYWLVHCLNIVTNRFDVPGCQVFPAGPGGVDAGKMLQLADRVVTKHKSRIGGYDQVMGSLPGGIMADEILTPGEGQIKALIVFSGNPLLSMPDTNKLRQALSSLDLLVSLDLYENETGGLSHYVLPSTDMYERWDMAVTGLMFNPSKSYLNYTDSVVKPEGECKDLWLGFHEILQAAGYHPMGLAPLSLFIKPVDALGHLLGAKYPLTFNPRLICAMMALASGVSWSTLKKSRQGKVLGDHGWGSFYPKRVLTKNRKARLAPSEFIAKKDVLEGYFQAEAAYAGFRLIEQRQRHTHNTWFHNVKSFMEKELTNKVTIHPEDARRLGIMEGDMVNVQSDTGRITLPAKLSDEVMPMVVSIPHGWGHKEPSGLTVASSYPGINVNVLTPSGPGRVEDFSGMAHLTGVHVSVSKA